MAWKYKLSKEQILHKLDVERVKQDLYDVWQLDFGLSELVETAQDEIAEFGYITIQTMNELRAEI